MFFHHSTHSLSFHNFPCLPNWSYIKQSQLAGDTVSSDSTRRASVSEDEKRTACAVYRLRLRKTRKKKKKVLFIHLSLFLIPSFHSSCQAFILHIPAQHVQLTMTELTGTLLVIGWQSMLPFLLSGGQPVTPQATLGLLDDCRLQLDMRSLFVLYDWWLMRSLYFSCLFLCRGPLYTFIVIKTDVIRAVSFFVC